MSVPMDEVEGYWKAYQAGIDESAAEVTRLRDALARAEEREAAMVEALTPFARADAAIGAERGPFRFETGTGYRLIEREDLARARAALAPEPRAEGGDADGE